MVSNCNKFVKVNPGDTCDAIAFWNGVAGTEWVKLWNAGVGSDCRTLQADTYVCIGVVGGTPTQPGNGITTPQPAHPGMVSNCNKFVKVNPGDTCDAIAFWNGVAGTEWVKLWNAGVGSDCRTLQADTYACIGVM
jgi:purine nucleoside permease